MFSLPPLTAKSMPSAKSPFIGLSMASIRIAGGTGALWFSTAKGKSAGSPGNLA
jgi:hypothetical protein